jgi:outer membrane protein assembly factor BamB
MNQSHLPNRFSLLLCILFFSLIPTLVFSQQEASEAKWRQALGGKVLSIPAAQAESVVMVTDDGMLRCYSYTGRLLWKFDAKGKLTPFVSRSREGTSYISRLDGTFMAINRSGRLLWTRNLPSPMIAAPLVGWDGRLFIPLERSMVCISASGDQRWQIQFDAALALPPVSDDKGGILTALKNNKVVHISPIGRVSSTMLSDTPVVLLPAQEPETPNKEPAFIMYYRSGKGELRDFDDFFQELPTLAGLPVAGKRKDTLVAILLDSGQIAVISVTENKMLWSGLGPGKIGGETLDFPLNLKTNTRPYVIFDERGIYILRLSGAAGFTSDGRRLWTITIQGAASSPCFSDEGMLYSGGNDWILYAYKLEDRVRSIARSLYGPAPEGSYHLQTMADPQLTTDPFLYDESKLADILSHIETLLKKGNIGPEEPASLALLIHIASTGQQYRGMPFQLQPAVQPFYRVWAIRLLGQLGSRETIPFLTNLAKKEDDNLVVSEIAAALGHIGLDPEGLALKTFDELIHSDLYRRDERVLVAITQSIAALCKFSGPPLSSAGIPYLIKLAEADMAPVVRNNAQMGLKSIMEY